ncbi:carbohydrate ABC transporter permease [Leifsonia sp. 21MFCrub1.1]|uniref:carbohydrate ABC transporter permease n=1 Tax=Leifsonia sp. 21MFCrub1.1 TaxID=1798223 RepID=UPI00089291E3|nr:sugar ABC transporter permease [Leifsonia sp. 21MFCrub1.1]SEB08824.1 carbohydrate ABC transporter membrane protein 1, CUT1 family [Leifsonia sp. 21MFCrub1.1]
MNPTPTTATAASRPAARPRGRAATGLVRRGLIGRSEARTAWLMLAPALVLLAWWCAAPIVQSVILSFQQVSKYELSQREFAGLQNYAQLFADPAFGRSVGITVTFVLGVVPAQTVLALLVASALHGATRGKAAFRTAFFVPYMTSTVAITTIFMQLFVKSGPITSLLTVFGLPNTTWYADPNLALSFLVIIYVYMFVGLYIVIFVGGIETVPAELYEAAQMDGAGVFRRFWTVTIPGIRPFAVFVLVAGVIQAVQVFDQAYVISGGTVLGSPAGATSTIVIYIYQQAFRLSNIGIASAATVLLLLVVVVAGVISRRIGSKEA